MKWLRFIILVLGLIAIWQLIVSAFALPDYILPTPLQVVRVLFAQWQLIAEQTFYTLIEMFIGTLLAIFLGSIFALTLVLSRHIRFWVFPILVITQIIPTFAIAPLLVIWFGYGMTSKIITVVIMLFFPIASTFYEGLKSTPLVWMEMAKIMGANRLRSLFRIQIPAALPALFSGIKIAIVFAPIGAIVSEWVGASRGLGFLMLNANGQLQIDLVFACLLVLIALTLLAYQLAEKIKHRVVYW